MKIVRLTSENINITERIDDVPVGSLPSRINGQFHTWQTVAKRLLTNIEPRGACLIWTGTKTNNGYGIIQIQGKRMHAHRAAYIAFCGAIDNDSLCICHRCDVRDCVNPDHLFLGTRSENHADMVSKNRIARGEKNGGGKKLTEEQVQQIRNSSGPQRAIAARFGISQGTVWRILRREIWAHL